MPKTKRKRLTLRERANNYAEQYPITEEQGGRRDNVIAYWYVQLASKGETQRAPFDIDTHVGGLLEPDAKVQVVAAVWLNSTGLAVHMEPTVTMVYQFDVVQ